MSKKKAPVTWNRNEDLTDEVRRTLEHDLRTLFQQAKPTSLVISSVYQGYSVSPMQRIVLGVEVRTPNSFHTHIVKLGEIAEIKLDYDGWSECVLSQDFASRIFTQLDYIKLSDTRAAAIYENGYLVYSKEQRAQSLLEVVEWATTSQQADLESVERVLYQVYSELDRWFYITSDDQDVGAALAFYGRRLRDVAGGWVEDPTLPSSERERGKLRSELRRDVTWILCAHEDYNCEIDPTYLDPVDYVGGRCRSQAIPRTLVGRAHGDLHGRNLLVGQQRGHAEFPTVFDYGEMSARNVLAWDFAKLEVELMRELLPRLFARADGTRERLLAKCVCKQWKAAPRDEMVERTLFFFEFARRLALLTDRIDSRDAVEVSTPIPTALATGDEAVDRLLAILWRIRKEAALCLGFRRGRLGEWRSEFYFAVAAYGLCNAKPKWKYESPQVCCALVAAGVAAAEVEKRDRRLNEQILGEPLPRQHCESYRVPLAHAHRLWKADQLDEALELLTAARVQFPYSVPLLQECALVLTDIAERQQQDDRRQQALQLLKPVSQLCAQFRDHETLARLGKVFRSMGDASWAGRPRSHEVFLRATADDFQYYKQAQECYQEAFEFSQNYFPGINAATLACIIGDVEKSVEISLQVKDCCERTAVRNLSFDDLIWTLATEGEARAHLVEFQPEDAARMYESALGHVAGVRKNMAQSMYNQVCRLWWVLGPARMQPVVDVFRDWERRNAAWLQAGPCGDCASPPGV